MMEGGSGIRHSASGHERYDDGRIDRCEQSRWAAARPVRGYGNPRWGRVQGSRVCREAHRPAAQGLPCRTLLAGEITLTPSGIRVGRHRRRLLPNSYTNTAVVTVINHVVVVLPLMQTTVLRSLRDSICHEIGVSAEPSPPSVFSPCRHWLGLPSTVASHARAPSVPAARHAVTRNGVRGEPGSSFRQSTAALRSAAISGTRRLLIELGQPTDVLCASALHDRRT